MKINNRNGHTSRGNDAFSRAAACIREMCSCMNCKQARHAYDRNENKWLS